MIHQKKTAVKYFLTSVSILLAVITPSLPSLADEKSPLPLTCATVYSDAQGKKRSSKSSGDVIELYPEGKIAKKTTPLSLKNPAMEIF